MTALVDPSDPAARRPLRRDAQRNREALLTAASKLFAERGLEVSMDEIARVAGVGVGTAYRHFANKYELAGELFRRNVDDMATVVDQALQIDDPWEALQQYVAVVVSGQVDNRGMREVLVGMVDLGGTGRAPMDVLRQLDEPLQALFDRAKDSGVVRADATLTDLGFAIVMLLAVADTSLDRAPTLWRRYLPMVMDGLRAGATVPDEPPLPLELMGTALAGRRRRLERTVEVARRAAAAAAGNPVD